METVTYNLCCGESNSNIYYDEIEKFSTLVQEKIEIQFCEIITDFSGFLITKNIEKIRSRGEYAVEILTIGLAWERYISASQNTSYLISRILIKLNQLRKKSQTIKPYIDYLKGIIIGGYFISKINSKIRDDNKSIENFNKLINWLDASGEFKDETKRLKNWEIYLNTKNEKFVEDFLISTLKIFTWFKTESDKKLSKFDGQLKEFIKNENQRTALREDSLFRRKEIVEYHLNMVGAELMNRGFLIGFNQTENKVLLVPGCMRINETACKAIINNLDILCTGCDKECNVNKLTNMGRKENFKVYIIPHSSSFTKWLKRWDTKKDTGLVAVACLLNLVPGGYEMRELGLNAQCILLDYCGCKKHWHPEGIPTEINTNKLLEVIRN